MVLFGEDLEFVRGIESRIDGQTYQKEVLSDSVFVVDLQLGERVEQLRTRAPAGRKEWGDHHDLAFENVAVQPQHLAVLVDQGYVGEVMLGRRRCSASLFCSRSSESRVGSACRLSRTASKPMMTSDSLYGGQSVNALPATLRWATDQDERRMLGFVRGEYAQCLQKMVHVLFLTGEQRPASEMRRTASPRSSDAPACRSRDRR